MQTLAPTAAGPRAARLFLACEKLIPTTPRHGASGVPAAGGSAARGEVVVRYREPLQLRGRPGLAVVCVDGTAWVTVDGRLEDVVLTAGQFHRLPSRGLALVTGLPACTVRVEESAAA